MSAFKRLLSSGAPALWLDYADYAGRLLAGGKIPWLDVAALIAWYRKAQGLLKSNVVALPLAPLIEAWLGQHGELLEAMRQKRRVPAPLKTLLADEGLRGHVAETLRGLRASMASVPLALVLASPRLWVSEAYLQAFGADSGPEVGADEADSAAVYIADFLRAFGDAGVDVLLLQESAATEPKDAEELECYRSVLNVSAHYRWACGLQVPAAVAGEVLAKNLDFVIAPLALPGIVNGLMVDAGYWSGQSAPAAPGGGFRFARIPPDIQPETALDRLGALR
jgi:hypothetical protein